MKYVITGSLGHISKPVTIALAKAGHDVTVITSSNERVKEIESLGAKAAVGSVADLAFLKKTFSSADAAYTMVPPNFAAPDIKVFIAQIGENYAEAIRNSNIKHVVNLSSCGADQSSGVGPVSGLHKGEKALNALEGVNVQHLRVGYFYDNFLANIALIKSMDIMGGNYGGNDRKMALSDTDDIAMAAIEELTNLNFKAASVRYVGSDERDTGDIARVIGKAIGKPDLSWVKFTDQEAFEGMKQAGLPQSITENYVEMGTAIDSGIMFADYFKNRPKLGKIKLEDFAKKFAQIYKAS
jgi:uncharacterized protein YbjT (DUF2867 family)